MPDGSRHMTSERSLSCDPVGRQVEHRGGVLGHLQEGAQVAELEAAVDQDDAQAAQLAHRHGEVEGQGRLAHAALRARTACRRGIAAVVESACARPLCRSGSRDQSRSR